MEQLQKAQAWVVDWRTTYGCCIGFLSLRKTRRRRNLQGSKMLPSVLWYCALPTYLLWWDDLKINKDEDLQWPQRRVRRCLSEWMSMLQRTTVLSLHSNVLFGQPVNWIRGQLHRRAGRTCSVSLHHLNFPKHRARTCTVYFKFHASGRKMGLIFLSHRKHTILQLWRHLTAPCPVVWEYLTNLFC